MGIGHASSSLSFKHLQYILEIYTYTLTWVSYQINSKLNVRIEQGKLFLESFIHIQLQVTLFSTQALKESEFIRAILFRFKKPPPSPSAPPALSLSYLAMNWEYSTEVFPQLKKYIARGILYCCALLRHSGSRL